MELPGARILAFGTSGAQGRGLVPALEAAGAVPVRVTSSPDRAAGWQSTMPTDRVGSTDRAGSTGRLVAAAVADLRDPTSVGAAAEATGATGAALHAPLAMGAPDDGERLLASVRELRRRGLPVTVALGSPVPPEGTPDPQGARDRVAALLDTGATVLTATLYLENHAAPWALAAITRGELVYPRPASDPVRWLAAGDLGTAAVAALRAGLSARLLPLAGPQQLTLTELADELATGLGRPLTFRRVSPTAYGELLAPVLGELAAREVAALYESFPEDPNPLFTADAATSWQLLGVEATTARQWASSTLADALAAGTASTPGARQ